MKSRVKFGFGETPKPACGTHALPSPGINKDLPALDAFKFQDAVLEPWVVLQFLSYLFFVFGIDD